MNSGLPASEPGLSGALGLVSSLSPATLAMDQPAGLQVDYVFRGVEHAVRVVVSGQVLELEVEDRMTADQWRGEFDASCECAHLGWVHLSFPGIPFSLKMRPTRNLPICLFYLTRDSLRWGGGVKGSCLRPEALELGEVDKLRCIALGLGKWSDFRKDFSLYPVIEDLTHKTGNFKQFNIFCNMLESALTQVGATAGSQGKFLFSGSLGR